MAFIRTTIFDDKSDVAQTYITRQWFRFIHVTFSVIHRLPSSLSDPLLKVIETGYEDSLGSCKFGIM